MKRKGQSIVSVIFMCLIIGGAWAFYEFSRPHKSAADKKTEATVTADTLYAAFTKDEDGANKIYLNKVIEVKGVVQDIAISDKKPVVFLNTSRGGYINCLMAADSATIFSALKKNTETIIKGKCSGFLLDVNLVDCVIKQ